MILTSAFDPSLRLILEPLPYVGLLEKRPLSQIDLVVMHCTELPDMAMAREYGERVLYEAGTGASGHYYIDRDGSIHEYVNPAHIANHTKGFNPRSIGIELVNIGRYPNWYDADKQLMTEAYTAEQISSLKKLLLLLKFACPDLQFIAGHEDLDTAVVPATDDPDKTVFRKRDPGPLFPWQEILAAVELKQITQVTP
ncbi:MAG: N-acetylmuramoyl-L-alanine amidase [Arenimonas sp.]